MENKKCAVFLKFGIILIALCVLFACVLIVPVLGRAILTDMFPEFSAWLLPWLVLIWLCALPLLASLICAFRVAEEIGKDNSFSMINAKMMKAVGWLLTADAAIFASGNVVLLFMNANHPGIVIISFAASLAIFSVALAAFVLSRLIHNAATLREESELTI